MTAEEIGKIFKDILEEKSDCTNIRYYDKGGYIQLKFDLKKYRGLTLNFYYSEQNNDYKNVIIKDIEVPGLKQHLQRGLNMLDHELHYRDNKYEMKNWFLRLGLTGTFHDVLYKLERGLYSFPFHEEPDWKTDLKYVTDLILGYMEKLEKLESKVDGIQLEIMKNIYK